MKKLLSIIALSISCAAFAALASEGWITNTTSRTVSRPVKTGETLALTNSLASITCSGGLGSANPTNAWLVSGERVVTSGTAKGKVFLVLER